MTVGLPAVTTGASTGVGGLLQTVRSGLSGVPAELGAAGAGLPSGSGAAGTVVGGLRSQAPGQAPGVNASSQASTSQASTSQASTSQASTSQASTSTGGLGALTGGATGAVARTGSGLDLSALNGGVGS